jgi:guanylate kinase
MTLSTPQLPVALSPGLLLVLSAPSGAGKTTLAHMLLQQFPPPQALFSISHTTRPPRGQERNGKDYHFVDVETFQQMIEENQFVEWAEVHGNFYGSSRSLIDQAMATRGIAVFDIDVQGGTSIKRKFPDATLVYVLPPSMAELERRLRARGTDADAVIRRRLLTARAEIEKGVETYDYLVINDRLDEAFQQLRSIVVAERARRGRVDLAGLKLSTS